MPRAFTIGFFGQITFSGEVFATHLMPISKTLNLLSHTSAKRLLFSDLNSPQRFLKAFPGTLAVNNSKRTTNHFIPDVIIHLKNLVNIYINIKLRHWLCTHESKANT
jgi:hypothetical protein